MMEFRTIGLVKQIDHRFEAICYRANERYLVQFIYDANADYEQAIKPLRRWLRGNTFGWVLRSGDHIRQSCGGSVTFPDMDQAALFLLKFSR